MTAGWHAWSALSKTQRGSPTAAAGLPVRRVSREGRHTGRSQPPHGCVLASHNLHRTAALDRARAVRLWWRMRPARSLQGCGLGADLVEGLARIYTDDHAVIGLDGFSRLNDHAVIGLDGFSRPDDHAVIGLNGFSRPDDHAVIGLDGFSRPVDHAVIGLDGFSRPDDHAVIGLNGFSRPDDHAVIGLNGFSRPDDHAVIGLRISPPPQKGAMRFQKGTMRFGKVESTGHAQWL